VRVDGGPRGLAESCPACPGRTPGVPGGPAGQVEAGIIGPAGANLLTRPSTTRGRTARLAGCRPAACLPVGHGLCHPTCFTGTSFTVDGHSCLQLLQSFHIFLPGRYCVVVAPWRRICGLLPCRAGGPQSRTFLELAAEEAAATRRRAEASGYLPAAGRAAAPAASSSSSAAMGPPVLVSAAAVSARAGASSGVDVARWRERLLSLAPAARSRRALVCALAARWREGFPAAGPPLCMSGDYTMG
jgi:hypothetical protein